MIERELNLHVPLAARTAIGKQLRALNAKKISLQARYFDTASRELATAKIGLRLRLEGKQWVQTVKALGPDALSRIEINHPRPDSTLDLSLYKDTVLEPAFAALTGPLSQRYETRVNRLVLQVKSGQSVVELAYDQGAIIAAGMELPISEIEFEHISGDMSAVFTLGRQWLQQHALILNLRSKAERGDLLAKMAQTAATPPDDHETLAPNLQTRMPVFKPRRSGKPNCTSHMSVHQAYLACANECLAQVIYNAAYTAGVDTAHLPHEKHMEYVHQLRVGTRRLRSCWKLFNEWTPAVDPELVRQLREGFSLLGGTRDSDVVRLIITPQLKRSGMPDCTLPSTPDTTSEHAAAVAGSVAFQTVLLGLLEHLVLYPADTSQPQPVHTAVLAAAQQAGQIDKAQPPSLKKALIKRLNNWSGKITAKGVDFEGLGITAQHNLRKRVKGLRYCVDFSEGILPETDLESLRKALVHIQQVLGELNDFYVAECFYRGIVADQPQAWFAVGWLRAMQKQRQGQAQAAFKLLALAAPLK